MLLAPYVPFHIFRTPGYRCGASLQQNEMVWTRRAQQRLDCSSTQAKHSSQKRSGKPRKSWDEVLLDDRKKLGMDTADPQNRSEWRGRLRRRLVKQVHPSVEDNRL